MKHIHSWHLSGFAILVDFALIIATASGAGVITVISVLALLPLCGWLGWTLHARKLYMESVLRSRWEAELKADRTVQRAAVRTGS